MNSVDSKIAHFRDSLASLQTLFTLNNSVSTVLQQGLLSDPSTPKPPNEAQLDLLLKTEKQKTALLKSKLSQQTLIIQQLQDLQKQLYEKIQSQQSEIDQLKNLQSKKQQRFSNSLARMTDQKEVLLKQLQKSSQRAQQRVSILQRQLLTAMNQAAYSNTLKKVASLLEIPPSQTYSAVLQLKQTSTQQFEATSLVSKISSLIKELSPPGQFVFQPPTVQQIWVWITNLSQQYMLLKLKISNCK